MPRHLTLAASPESAPERLSWPLLRPIEEPGWSHTLVLTGRLDDRSASELEEEIECLCQEGVKHITIDLRQLDALDARGARSIAFSSSHCARRGQSFAVIAGSNATRRALTEAGLSEALRRQPASAVATADTRAALLRESRDLATMTIRAL